jgi:hypothetical protein
MERLDEQHISYISTSASDWRAWKWRLENTEPEAAQLAAMQKGTVLRLLRMVVVKFLKGNGKTLPRRISRWVWSLLARLPARGELGSEEVGVVRDLGKRAVLVGVGLRGIDTQGLDGGADEGTVEEEEIVDVEVHIEEARTDEAESEDPPIIGPVLPTPHHTPQQSDHTTEPNTTPSHNSDPDSSADALAAARNRLLARLQDPDSEQHQTLKETQEDVSASRREAAATREEAREQEHEEGEYKGGEDEAEAGHIDEIQNTRATIDMILTIAGEMYGQRDLLEFREVWE